MATASPEEVDRAWFESLRAGIDFCMIGICGLLASHKLLEGLAEKAGMELKSVERAMDVMVSDAILFQILMLGMTVILMQRLDWPNHKWVGIFVPMLTAVQISPA